MQIRTDNRQTAKNIIVTILAFVAQFSISFVVSPIIVSNVGVTAYGFVGIANDIVSYGTLITAVFNSVAARFIAKAFYEKKYEEANGYYNSLIVVNFYIALFVGIIGAILVPNLARLISIPEELIVDVQITFALIFGTYIITILSLAYTTATFVTNRSDLAGMRNFASQLVRLLLLVVFIIFIDIKIYWVAVASMAGEITLTCMNVGLTKKLTPELKIDLRKASKEYAYILASSGIWMSVGHISNLLNRGLNLLIANQNIGSREMGLLSIAQVIPGQVVNIVGTVGTVFTPVLISYYFNKTKSELLDKIKSSINTMVCLFAVPIIGYIIYSYDFIKLWQNSLSHSEVATIALLSSIFIAQSFFDATAYTLGQLSVVTNKLKIPMCFNALTGVVNIALIFVLIKFTDLGVFAIPISNTIIMSLRYFLFNSIYAAYMLKEKVSIFFASQMKTWLCVPVLIAVVGFVKYLLPVHSWTTFFLSVGTAAALGYVIILLLYGRPLLVKAWRKIRHR